MAGRLDFLIYSFLFSSSFFLSLLTSAGSEVLRARVSDITDGEE